ncbi:CoA transferase [Povalibacter sp.]|uniref:CaiB/BaiF CoA transferase family protein n=1 Tax=Povalibacter sp. TaxID=1962978 RepID=UPI002F3EA190
MSALADVRVLDFSKFLPGPYCSWMLADLGATVVRIENPREAAKQAKVFGWDRLSVEQRARLRANDVFARNKHSLLIDPGAAASREVILEFVRRADILLEDYRPGVLASMGFGYADMAAINPRLIYCSVTLCGQTGPYRDKPGHDPIALALSGALSRMGDRTERPSFAGVPTADLLTGSNAVIGILAALYARERSGRGQQIDIAMSDSAMTLIASTMARNPDLSRVRPRGEGRIDCGLWRTADGRYLCTTDMEPRYWERFCRAMGREEFIPLQLDASRHEEMTATFAAIFATRTQAEWLTLLGEADTQFAPVYEIAEALADAHNLARHMIRDVPLPGGSTVRQLGSPIKLSSTPVVEPRAAALPDSDVITALQSFGCDPRTLDTLKGTAGDE